MTPELLLHGEPGRTYLLMGNEAIARGALEAGIAVATCYPGTPATEIVTTLAAVAKKAGIYVEYSVNEIAALEVAAGVAFSGVRALSAMKHVGVNVASDALFTLAYTGVRGALIIISADDPNAYSSQSEQDNRYYAMHALIPMIEPSDQHEAKEAVKYSVYLSEKFETPVLLRTTTRINHGRGPVKFGEVKRPILKGTFKRDPERFVAIPAFVRTRRQELLRRIAKLEEEANRSPWNVVVGSGDSKYGIIASGYGAAVAAEAIAASGSKIDLLKLEFSFPLPKQLVANFLRTHEKVLVVEELEPLLEEQVKAVAYEFGIRSEIYGKGAGIPRAGDLLVEDVKAAMFKVFLGVKFEKPTIPRVDIAKRAPTLCPGCPHRASIFELKSVFGENTIYASDIGCYGLAVLPPLSVGDTLICMGASIGVGSGISLVNEKRVVAIIGDSTFFHAGIPLLINAAYNDHDLTIAILDNGTTAMTGHQPHPGVGITALGKRTKEVLIEDIVRAIGVECTVLDPLNVEESIVALSRIKKTAGLKAVVFRSPCALMTIRELRRAGKNVTYYAIDESSCKVCNICYGKFGCPAIYVSEVGIPVIEPMLCVGCGVCARLCPYGAINPAGERVP